MKSSDAEKGCANRLLSVKTMTNISDSAQRNPNVQIHLRFAIADFRKNPLFSKCKKLIEKSKPMQVTPKVKLKKLAIGVATVTKVPGSGNPFSTPLNNTLIS